MQYLSQVAQQMQRFTNNNNNNDNDNDESQNTTIQIRLPNGERLVHHLANNTPVGVLYSLVEVAASHLVAKFPNTNTDVSEQYVQDLMDVEQANDGEMQGSKFVLATSFPRRDLLEVEQTLEEADLVPSASLVVVAI
jgi:hypothetical protein